MKLSGRCKNNCDCFLRVCKRQFFCSGCVDREVVRGSEVLPQLTNGTIQQDLGAIRTVSSFPKKANLSASVSDQHLRCPQMEKRRVIRYSTLEGTWGTWVIVSLPWLSCGIYQHLLSAKTQTLSSRSAAFYQVTWSESLPSRTGLGSSSVRIGVATAPRGWGTMAGGQGRIDTQVAPWTNLLLSTLPRSPEHLEADGFYYLFSVGPAG